MPVRKDPTLQHDDDINASIIGVGLGEDVRSALQQSPTGVAIEDATLIQDDLFDNVPPQRRRFKPMQLAILGITGVFALGGVASMFYPTPHSSVQALAQDNTHLEAPAASLPSQLTLPAGLAFNDPSKEPAPTQPTAAPAGIATTANAPSVTQPAPGSATPPKVTETEAPAHQQRASIQPAAPAVPVAPVAGNKPAPPEADATQPKPAHPAADAKATAPSITAKPVLATARQPSNTKTASPSPRPVAASPAMKAPTVAAVKPTTEKPAVQPVAKKVADDAPRDNRHGTAEVASSLGSESGSESIKKLIATTADEFGLQSIHEGGITLVRGRDGAPQRLSAGERLPNGELILRVDARSMTLVTDRSVIRFN